MKKLLSLLLAAVMLITLMPAAAFAADSDKIISDEAASELIDRLIDGVVGEVDSFSAVSLLKVKHIKSYTSLGDSTVFGYGLKGMFDGDDAFNGHYGYGVASVKDFSKNSPGLQKGSAYPIILAEKLGIDLSKEGKKCDFCDEILYYGCSENGIFSRKSHFAQLAMGRLRAEDLLAVLSFNSFDLLEYKQNELAKKSFFANALYGNYINAFVRHYGSEQYTDDRAFFKMQSDYRKNIKNSDLITLSIGGNVGNFVQFLLERNDMEYAMEQIDYELGKYIPSVSLLNKALDAMDKLLASAGVNIGDDLLPGIDVKALAIKALLYAYLGICENTEAIIKEVHRLNRDAVIVVTGLYNPIDDVSMKIGDGNIEIKVGKLASLLINKINRELREYAILHSSYCCYVDISDAEMLLDHAEELLGYSAKTVDDLMSNDFAVFTAKNGVAVHESAAGHEYIANQIYNSLYRKGFGLFK